MKEMMKTVSHQQTAQLLHNKFVVVLGDSIQRSVYKDIVLLLQKDTYLSIGQLKHKGEMNFEQDCLVEGGCLNQMHNGTEYQEVRQFRSAHHLVRFYFVTRIYSRYMQSILEDFRQNLKPDVVIVNSCVWDISRYNSSWIDDYQENLHKFFNELKATLPEETLIIWNLTMPLGERIKGGFLVSEIEHKAPHLRHDVIEANYYSGTLADAYGLDVLDLHFHFRFYLHHRMKDGVHWNAHAHRRITSLLLQHTAQAWGVILPCPLTTVGEDANRERTDGNATRPSGTTDAFSGEYRAECASDYSYPPPSDYFSNMEHRENFYNDLVPFGFLNFEQTSLHNGVAGGSHDGPAHHFPPYRKHHHQDVMRSRHSRHHYAPYTRHRPRQHYRHGSYS